MTVLCKFFIKIMLMYFVLITENIDILMVLGLCFKDVYKLGK